MRKISIFCLFIGFMAFFAGPVYAHCEIPCGIYDDPATIQEISEHIKTIEKSMNLIMQLSKQKEKNYNQLVRWINNKEAHANYIQEIVWQYFMAQRIKPASSADKKDYEKYVKEVTLLHAMIVYAMKAKQSVDLGVVEKLRSLLSQFENSYFGEHHHHE